MTATRPRTLAREALLKSLDVRSEAGLSLNGPMDIYALCDHLGITVQFVPFSMEGLYRRGHPPRILLSAMRPLVRRNYTCAHEVGHHVFGHGSTIDELTAELATPGTFQPAEFLVQTFAGFLLMPTLAIRKAFAQRGWSATSATPAQLATVAGSFGVGYSTLVDHLTYSLDLLPRARADQLRKVPPARIRRELLGTDSARPLVVVDAYWSLPTIDIEVGTHLLLPLGVEVEGDLLEYQAELLTGCLYVARKSGIARVDHEGTNWAAFVRISRFQYVGLSQYRHLEDSDDEDGEEADGDQLDESGGTYVD